MIRSIFVAIVLLQLFFAAEPCHAARVKAFVNRFSVTVTDNREELKQSLQTLLMSRLNSDVIQAVDKSTDADIQIDGSYIVFGTIFSLDALVKTTSGAFVDRVFVQGDSMNELIPSVARMALAIQRSLATWDPSLAVTSKNENLAIAAEKPPVASSPK